MRGKWSRWPRDARVAVLLAGLVLLQTVALAAFGLEAADSQRAEAERGLRDRSGLVLAHGVQGPAREAVSRLESSLVAAAGRGVATAMVRERVEPDLFHAGFALLPDGSVVDSRGVVVVAEKASAPGPADPQLRDRLRALEDLAATGGELREISLQAEEAVRETEDDLSGARGLRLAARCALKAGEDDRALRAAEELLRRYADLAVEDEYPFGAGAAALAVAVHRRRLQAATPGAAASFVDSALRCRSLLVRAPLPASLRLSEAEALRSDAQAVVDLLDTESRTRLVHGLERLDSAEREARLISPATTRGALADATAGAGDGVGWVVVPDGETEVAWALVRARGGGLLAHETTVSALRDYVLHPLLGRIEPEPGVAVRVMSPDRRPLDGGGEVPSSDATLSSLGVDLPTGGVLAEALLQDRGLLESEVERLRNFILAVVVAAVVALGLGWLLVMRMVRAEVRLAGMKADFVSGVSHELKTPLTSIRMFLETLRDGRARTEEDRQECLEVIEREAGRLDRLVEGVLEFSRHSAGTATLRLAPEEPGRIVEEAAEVFRGHLPDGSNSFHVDIEEELPVMQLDRDAVTQVLLNLLDNAVKYAPEPRRIDLVATRGGGNSLRLVVEDDGPGVAPSERASIFEDFVRGKDTGESGAGGTGLGLALVRRLAEAHGGGVHVEDGSSGGARFVVTLPHRAAVSGSGERP